MNNKTFPIFSVVVPLYNKEKEVGNTIKSVLNQVNPNFELIIVNDGSTDSSIQVVNQFLDPRIKIINKPNGGVSSARNAGIFQAKGMYIALLDADDIWLPEYLQEIEQLINKFGDCSMFCTDYSISSIKLESDIKVIQHSIVNNYFEVAMYAPFLTASSIVVKRDCFDGNILFNENFTHGEDLDLWARLYKKYSGIGYSNRQLVYYNHSADNRACKSVTLPQKHFAYFLNPGKIKDIKEKRYYLYQISSLLWMYLRNLKIRYLITTLLKYKKFFLIILSNMIGMAVSNKYKIAVKNK